MVATAGAGQRDCAHLSRAPRLAHIVMSRLNFPGVGDLCLRSDIPSVRCSAQVMRGRGVHSGDSMAIRFANVQPAVPESVVPTS